MLWEISTTAMPWSASRRTSSSTCAVCATPSAAVGSSSRTTLEFHSTDLAIATVWRWPPDRLETRWRTDLTVRTDSEASVAGGRLLHRDLVEDRAGVASPGRGTCSARCRGCRTARGPGTRSRCRVRPRRAGECTVHRPALEEVLAGVDRVGAADALDQRRLAGAVVTDQRGDLAGVGPRSRRRCSTCTGAEALVDRRRAAGSVRSWLSCRSLSRRPELAGCRVGWTRTQMGRRASRLAAPPPDLLDAVGRAQGGVACRCRPGPSGCSRR